MSEYALLDIWTGPDQAKASIQHRLAPFCRSMWEQGIERLTVTVEPEDDAKTLVAGRKRPVISTSLGTTKGLKVKPMSKYIEQVIAYAVTELGVHFSSTRWEDYR